MCAAIGDINAACIQVHRLTAKRSHTVGEKESTAIVCNLNRICQGLQDTGGCFSVHQCNQFQRGSLRNGFRNLFRRNVCSPLCFYRCNDTSTSCGDVGDPLAKVTIDTDNDTVTGFNNVGECCFHACGTSTGDWQRQSIFGSKNLAEQCHRVIHHFNKFGI